MTMPILPGLVRRPRRNDAEFRLQCALVKHIQARLRPGVYWTALPFGEKRSKATAGRLKAMGVQAGAPDLMFLSQGRCYGLELKAGANKQTEAQRLTEVAWRAAGGHYAVATGMDEALFALTAWRLIRPEARLAGRAA